MLKKYEEPPFDRKEIFRYMGCPKPSPEVAAMTEECIAEARPRLSYKVCWREFAISGAGADGRPHKDERPGSDGRPGGVMIPAAQHRRGAGSQSGASLDLGFTVTHSRDLQKNLKGCCRIILFGATVGLELDRLIARYGQAFSVQSPVLSAIGAERIESLCNAFNDEIDEIFREQGMYTRPRFSPGYGDLPINMQKDIFAALDCPRKIGLSLNESLLMSPSKSVTAIIGVSARPKQAEPRKLRPQSANREPQSPNREPQGTVKSPQATTGNPQAMVKIREAALPAPNQTVFSGRNDL